jgi:hypothetical protein
MNFFVLFKGAKRPELVTAPLDGTILDGVVRSSILVGSPFYSARAVHFTCDVY